MEHRTIVRPEDTHVKPRRARLAMFLIEDDALLVYKLLNGYRLVDGSGERLSHLIEEHYEETFENRLTEPWEWED